MAQSDLIERADALIERAQAIEELSLLLIYDREVEDRG